jgi:thiol-disulfide isomerase/thioredoxin
MSTPSPTAAQVATAAPTAAPVDPNANLLVDGIPVKVLNKIQIDTPTQCDRDSHDFKDCDVYYLEDFDFSFNNSVLKPSQADPNSVYIVKIFAQWCGHCKRMMPQYKDFAKMMKDLKNSKYKVCCIDGTGQGTRESERVLTKRIKEVIPGFQGFPTIVTFMGGKLKDIYNGPRTADALYDFVKSKY